MNNPPSNNTMSKRTVLVIASLSSFLTPFMSSAINISLPSIGTEFAMSAMVLSWVATSFLLAAAVFLVPFGRIADIHGRKKIFTLGIVVYTAASAACAISTSGAALIMFRTLQGIGSAMMFGTGMAILTSVFPPGERGRALGINVTAVYLGLSLGPFLGGLLTQQFGWRSVFLANIPLGLAMITLAVWKLKGEWAGAKGERFDLAGSLIWGVTLVAIMYGLSRLPGKSGALILGAGILGAAIFTGWEMRVKSPVLDIKLFRNNTVFALSNVAALINYAATFAVTFLMSLYLQYIKGFSPRTTGLILVAQPIVMAMFSPFAGSLSDRTEPRVVASVGMALATAGLCLMSFVSGQTPMGYIVGSLAVLGLGFALFSSPNTNAVMSSVEMRFYGVASGTLGTMRLMGQMLSMGLAALILSVYMGSVKIVPATYPNFLRANKTAFLVFAGLCFAGIFASLARGRVRK